MATEQKAAAPTGFARWVPGITMLRTYQGAWLRPDLVAGVVLAAILVPQGMAYAELAGLPAGHRPLHDDRVPRRVRALRPVAGPGARARLVGLAADLRGDRPARRRRTTRPSAIALAGMLALLVGADRDRPRARQARVRRRPPLQGGAGRLHERARDHDHRRAAAEAVRLLDRRRRLRRARCRRSSRASTRPNTDHARSSGLATLVVLLVLPRVTTRIPAVLVAVVGATVVTALLGLRR